MDVVGGLVGARWSYARAFGGRRDVSLQHTADSKI